MNQKQTMKERRPEEQPYEKCQKLGAEHLTDAELLSVILRTGTTGVSAYELAGQVLRVSQAYQGLLGICHLTQEELESIRGIGRVKAVQIRCIAELSRRIAKATVACQVYLSTPQLVAEYLMEDMRHAEQEQLVLLMLNSKNRVLREKMIFKGTVSYSCVSPREIYIEALQAKAVHIVLVHNHPSGDPAPSQADIVMTQQIQEAGELLGITLLDHIIIGDHRFVSLKEKGVLV